MKFAFLAICLSFAYLTHAEITGPRWWVTVTTDLPNVLYRAELPVSAVEVTYKRGKPSFRLREDYANKVAEELEAGVSKIPWKRRPALSKLTAKVRSLGFFSDEEVLTLPATSHDYFTLTRNWPDEANERTSLTFGLDGMQTYRFLNLNLITATCRWLVTGSPFPEKEKN